MRNYKALFLLKRKTFLIPSNNVIMFTSPSGLLWRFNYKGTIMIIYTSKFIPVPYIGLCYLFGHIMQFYIVHTWCMQWTELKLHEALLLYMKKYGHLLVDMITAWEVFFFFLQFVQANEKNYVNVERDPHTLNISLGQHWGVCVHNLIHFPSLLFLE